MLEPRVTTAPVSLLTELRLVSGSQLAAFELKVADKVLLDALDSEEHDGDLHALAAECRATWTVWKNDLIAWLEQESTEMRMVEMLTKLSVIATIANVAAGGGLDGTEGE